MNIEEQITFQERELEAVKAFMMSRYNMFIEDSKKVDAQELYAFNKACERVKKLSLDIHQLKLQKLNKQKADDERARRKERRRKKS